MFVVDANVFIYSLNRTCDEHIRCRTLLERWRSQPTPWYTTWGIVYEVLRVASHPRVFRKPLAVNVVWEFLASVMASPSFTVLAEGPRHAEVLESTLREINDIRGNLLHDTHTAIVMREHGIRRIYTRDTDFHRFPFLEVLDPLRVSA